MASIELPSAYFISDEAIGESRRAYCHGNRIARNLTRDEIRRMKSDCKSVTFSKFWNICILVLEILNYVSAAFNFSSSACQSTKAIQFIIYLSAVAFVISGCVILSGKKVYVLLKNPAATPSLSPNAYSELKNREKHWNEFLMTGKNWSTVFNHGKIYGSLETIRRRVCREKEDQQKVDHLPFLITEIPSDVLYYAKFSFTFGYDNGRKEVLREVDLIQKPLTTTESLTQQFTALLLELVVGLSSTFGYTGAALDPTLTTDVPFNTMAAVLSFCCILSLFATKMYISMMILNVQQKLADSSSKIGEIYQNDRYTADAQYASVKDEVLRNWRSTPFVSPLHKMSESLRCILQNQLNRKNTQ